MKFSYGAKPKKLKKIKNRDKKLKKGKQVRKSKKIYKKAEKIIIFRKLWNFVNFRGLDAHQIET